jgi:hypothetical protein
VYAYERGDGVVYLVGLDLPEMPWLGVCIRWYICHGGTVEISTDGNNDLSSRWFR